jgi:hypothetical protein
MRPIVRTICPALLLLALSQAQVPTECIFFGPKQSEWMKSGLQAQARKDYAYSRLAMQVSSKLPPLSARDATAPAAADSIEGLARTTEPRRPVDSRVPSYSDGPADPVRASKNLIDTTLAQVWKDASVTPAAQTTDFEFLRRVTLDLTGRIPTPQDVQKFVADTDPNKRTNLIENLLQSPAFVDKWTMFFGDLFKNTVRNTQIVRYNDGRNAFYKWIRQSVAGNKPYNQMVTELITAKGSNSYEQGELNWLAGTFVGGGPVQDVWDSMAVNTAQTFLGISHMNCILCHNGRGHLDTLSLWGQTATRYEGYQLASFFSHTALTRTRVNPSVANPVYYSLDDNTRYRTDYPLNTTTGNRPARTPMGTVRTVAPEYPFSGNAPGKNDDYRAFLAREVTSDFQFARATVNYIWKEFMGKAFVEPMDQFDPARLDPDNPPPDPWTLQPNQPRLLNALAQSFIDSNFDLRALMRTIATSETYQLSSRYDGQWQPAWEDMYARHIPRRLWAEEIHDAIVQSSGMPVTYAVPGLDPVDAAMKLPDVVNLPGNAAMRSWLDSFFRGNRDNEPRKAEGSTLQVLNLMNDSFVLSRTRAAGRGDNANMLMKLLTSGSTNEQIVSTLFLNVLSRYPTDAEKSTALAALGSGNRQQKAEDLMWALYNKVDFFFNY